MILGFKHMISSLLHRPRKRVGKSERSERAYGLGLTQPRKQPCRDSGECVRGWMPRFKALIASV